MMPPENAAAPGASTEGEAITEAGGPTLIVRGTLSWVEFAAHVDGTFVVLVKLGGGRFRRRCFLTVKAAEDAARRAQLRGENAVVMLAELAETQRRSVVHGEQRSAPLTKQVMDAFTRCPISNAADQYAVGVLDGAMRRRIPLAGQQLTRVADEAELGAAMHVVSDAIHAVGDLCAPQDGVGGGSR